MMLSIHLVVVFLFASVTAAQEYPSWLQNSRLSKNQFLYFCDQYQYLNICKNSTPNPQCNSLNYTSACYAGFMELQRASGPTVVTACCPGFYCPPALSCMVPCSQGGYCPLLLNGSDTTCAPFGPTNFIQNAGCGGASTDYPCPAGSFCNTTQEQHLCEEGSYCPEGSLEPYPCCFMCKCPTAGLAVPNFNGYALAIALGCFVGVMVVIGVLYCLSVRSHCVSFMSCSPSIEYDRAITEWSCLRVSGNLQRLHLEEPLLFPAGQITAIIGSSGCGKSTLVKALLGIEDFSGLDVHPRPDDLTWAYVPQHDALLPGLTVDETLAFTARLALTEPFDNLEDTAAEISLRPEILYRKSSSSLSGGEKRRISFLDAVARKPSVLVLDEATTGLDANTCENLVTFLKEKCQKGQLLEHTAVIVVIHQPSKEVFKMFHQIIVLGRQEGENFGKFLTQGPPNHIIETLETETTTTDSKHNPADELVYLAATPEEFPEELRMPDIVIQLNSQFTGKSTRWTFRHHFCTLFIREWTMYIGRPGIILLNLTALFGVGFIIGVLFNNPSFYDLVPVHFFSLVAYSLISVFTSSQLFPLEFYAVFEKEYASGLNVMAFVLAKCMFGWICQLIYALEFWISVVVLFRPMNAQEASGWFLSFWLTGFMCQAVVMLSSSVTRSFQAGLPFIILYMVVSIFLSGFEPQIGEINNTVYEVLCGMLSHMRWNLIILFQSERSNYSEVWKASFDKVEAYYHFEPGMPITAFLAFFQSAVVYVMAACSFYIPIRLAFARLLGCFRR